MRSRWSSHREEEDESVSPLQVRGRDALVLTRADGSTRSLVGKNADESMELFHAEEYRKEAAKFCQLIRLLYIACEDVYLNRERHGQRDDDKKRVTQFVTCYSKMIRETAAAKNNTDDSSDDALLLLDLMIGMEHLLLASLISNSRDRRDFVIETVLEKQPQQRRQANDDDDDEESMASSKDDTSTVAFDDDDDAPPRYSTADELSDAYRYITNPSTLFAQSLAQAQSQGDVFGSSSKTKK